MSVINLNVRCYFKGRNGRCSEAVHFLRTLTKSYAFKRLNYEITVWSVNKSRWEAQLPLHTYRHRSIALSTFIVPYFKETFYLHCINTVIISQIFLSINNNNKKFTLNEWQWIQCCKNARIDVFCRTPTLVGVGYDGARRTKASNVPNIPRLTVHTPLLLTICYSHPNIDTI